MKYVLVIGDGMADNRLPQLANHTPLEVLALNSFDRCAGCFAGRALTVPHGMTAESGAAMLSLLGYPPQIFLSALTGGRALPDFRQKHGHGGSMIAADKQVKTIAHLAGLKTPEVEGANGQLDTHYEGKVACALAALESGDDFAAVHIKAPDVMAHAGDLGGKLEAVQNVEYRVVMPLLNRLMGKGEDFRLLLICDHATLLSTGTHGSGLVPYAVFDNRVVRRALDEGKEPTVRKYSEGELACEPVLMDGTDVIRVLFEQYGAASQPAQKEHP